MIKGTKVTRTNKHDLIAVAAKFPSGATLRFSISRNGERLAVNFDNDRATLNKQALIVANWLKFRASETNGQRLDRLAALCASHQSGGQMIAAIESGAA